MIELAKIIGYQLKWGETEVYCSYHKKDEKNTPKILIGDKSLCPDGYYNFLTWQINKFLEENNS